MAVFLFAFAILTSGSAEAKPLRLSFGPSGTMIAYQGSSGTAFHLGGGGTVQFRMSYFMGRFLPIARVEPHLEYNGFYTAHASEKQLLQSVRLGLDFRLRSLILGANVGWNFSNFITGSVGASNYFDLAVRLGLFFPSVSRKSGWMLIGSWNHATARLGASSTPLGVDQATVSLLYQFRLFGGSDD